MKQQISRLSPHQNAKVAAVLSAVTSLILLVPFFLLASVFGAGQGTPVWMIIIFPIIYLVFGYIFTVIACALYNVIVPMTGGIEYEATGATGSTA
jgi:hypothetical protein